MNEERLWEHYKNALEEYRFQLQFNWSRSQYYFVLCAALLAAAVGLRVSTDLPRLPLVALYGAAAIVAFLALFANATQTSYYRAARDKKQRIEEQLDLGDLALATTPAMGSGRKRLGRVRTFQYTMVVVLLAISVVGGVEAIFADPTPERVDTMLTVVTDAAGPLPVAVAPEGEADVEARARARPGVPVRLTLEPGDYRVAVLVEEAVCEDKLEVTNEPMNVAQLDCP